MSLAYQVHHIIPLNVLKRFDNALMDIFGAKNLEEYGKVIQSYNNRISLFTQNDMAEAAKGMGRDNLKQAAFGAINHNTGGHPVYNRAVSDKIEDIVTSTLTVEEKKMAFISLQKVLKDT